MAPDREKTGYAQLVQASYRAYPEVVDLVWGRDVALLCELTEQLRLQVKAHFGNPSAERDAMKLLTDACGRLLDHLEPQRLAGNATKQEVAG